MHLTSEDFDRLKSRILAASGILLKPGKEYLIETRLAPLLMERGILSYRELSDRLDKGEEPLFAQVVDAITTNETLWFRDASFFGPLTATILPELLTRLEKGPVSIWSAACSTGQEPYSLVILLLEENRKRGRGALPPGLSILATDLSSQALDQARRGQYNQFAISRGLSQEVLDRYFRPAGIHYETLPQVRQPVRFESFNLLSSFAGKGPFDLVLCRNVLIYFPEEIKQEIFGKIRRVLKPGGMLALGASEAMWGGSKEFERVMVGQYPFYRPTRGAVAPSPAPIPREIPARHERRNYTRIPLRLEAELQLDQGRVFKGMTRDVSYGGVCFAGGLPMPEPEAKTVTLRLVFHRFPRKREAVFKCYVTRWMPLGAGVRFVSTDQEGYGDLKNVLMMNGPDGDLIQKEISEHPGLLVTGRARAY